MSDEHGASRRYLTDFSPEKFIAVFYTPKNNESGLDDLVIDFTIKFLSQAFAEGLLKGKRILDVGSGPCITSAISASSHFEEIYLSDFAPQNLEFLQKWWRGEMTYMQPIIRFFIDSEHKSESVEERNSEMRRKVKGIFPIDVLKPNPLEPSTEGDFDTITSSLCLEVAATDFHTYVTCLQNVTSLLKPGGYILLVGVLDQSYYEFEGTRFKTAKLSKSEVESAITLAGCEVVKAQYISINNARSSDTSGVYSLIGKKNQ
ncbi:hypothetical protein ScPMuIL_017231 [Solemya velum]